MARLLQVHHPTHPFPSNNTSTFFVLVVIVAAIASVVMFLCTTRKHSKMRKASQRSSPESERTLLSHISSKALLVMKMVSWKKGGQKEDGAVWKKTIIMGDKCRPLDFSGQILYDSEGNQLPKPSARLNDDGD